MALISVDENMYQLVERFRATFRTKYRNIENYVQKLVKTAS